MQMRAQLMLTLTFYLQIDKRVLGRGSKQTSTVLSHHTTVGENPAARRIRQL
jgi:hypothetical protein